MPKIVWSKPGGFDCVIREVVTAFDAARSHFSIGAVGLVYFANSHLLRQCLGIARQISAASISGLVRNPLPDLESGLVRGTGVVQKFLASASVLCRACLRRCDIA